MPDGSFFKVGPEPNYNAPLPTLGLQLGDRLADLPNKYFEGQQHARTIQLQNAFPDGPPRLPNGEIDIKKLNDTLVKLGGVETALPIAQQEMDLQIGRNAGRDVTGGPQPVAPNGVGPNQINFPRQQTNQQPQQPAFDNSSANTVQGLATEVFGGRDVSDLIPRYAAAAKVKPDQPLSPQQIQQVRTQMARTAEALRRPPPTADANAEPGSPQPSAPAPQQPQGPTGNGAMGPLSGYPAQMQQMQEQETYLRGQAAQYASRKPEVSVQLEKQAASLQAFRQKMYDELQSATAPTEAQKNLRSGATQRGEELKGEIDRSNHMYGAMQAGASTYQTDLKPALEFSRSVLNDPQFYSGAGASASLNWNKIQAAFGNTKAAQLKEAFAKVTATSVLQQSNQLRFEMQEAGDKAGRLFQQQAALMNESSPRLETTIAGNRTLVEYQSRQGELRTVLAERARAYVRAHGHLDAGFDDEMANYLTAHPLFSKEELAHPDLLGAPQLPPGLKGEQIVAFARAWHLRPGDPIRRSDGRGYITVPRQ
jgi:hypothetical protein